MFNLKNLLAVSIVSTLAVQANAETPVAPNNVVSFSGEITAPTCIVAEDSLKVTLDPVATTQFKATEGGVRVAGEKEFTLKINQSTGDVGKSCPSIAFIGSAEAKVPSLVNATASENLIGEGYLKNTTDTRDAKDHTVAIQITNVANTSLDLTKADAFAAAYSNGAFTYKARYVALKETGDVEVQQVTAAMSVRVDYR